MADLRSAAEANGLTWHFLPVVAGQITEQDINDFSALMSQIKGPVLAFCRTGTRSSTLWALSEAQHLSVDAILSTTAAAG